LSPDGFCGAGHIVGRRCTERQATSMRALQGMRRQGATLKHPTWGGNSIGFMPFPVDA